MYTTISLAPYYTLTKVLGIQHMHYDDDIYMYLCTMQVTQFINS